MKKLLLKCCLLIFAVCLIYITFNRKGEDDNKIEEQLVSNNEVVLYAGVERVVNITQEHVGINSKKDKDIKSHKGWTTTRVNIREYPNTDAKVLDDFEFNTMITYTIYNKKWAVIDYNNKKAYVCRDYIAKNENDYTDYSVPNNKGFKSYMSYKTITNKDSKQYELQSNHAYTGKHGIRMVDDRYCIAIGTYFDAAVGTYVDLILENGTVISCIIADIKADKDTNADNIVTLHNGCVTEFIVDTSVMNKNAKKDGDISSCRDEWSSPVVKIKVYSKNIL